MISLFESHGLFYLKHVSSQQGLNPCGQGEGVNHCGCFWIISLATLTLGYSVLCWMDSRRAETIHQYHKLEMRFTHFPM